MRSKKLSSAEEGRARLRRLKHALQLFRPGYSISEGAVGQLEAGAGTRVAVLPGQRIDGEHPIGAAATADTVLAGDQLAGFFGWDVATAGDINGDGILCR